MNMNERAIELYKQAIEFAYTSIGKDHADTSYFQGTVAGKFAELIVRECAEVADLADENKCEWIGGNILTRFGVEE
jgi:hypothetical protein